MKEFKGTKGEWELNFEKALYFSIKVEPDLYVEIFDSEDSAPGVLEANAKLIAQAPNLLKALLKVRLDLKLLGLPEDSPMRKEVEQAINKAL